MDRVTKIGALVAGVGLALAGLGLLAGPVAGATTTDTDTTPSSSVAPSSSSSAASSTSSSSSSVPPSSSSSSPPTSTPTSSSSSTPTTSSSTTSTTEAPTTTSSTPDQPAATIKVSTQASCANATPYLNWNVTSGGAPFDAILLHVLDDNGTEVLRLHEPSGSVLWPGWTRVDNRMTLTNPAVAVLHVYADITFGSAAVLNRSQLLSGGVVSTGSVSVAFPVADTACVGEAPTPPTVEPVSVAPVADVAAAPAAAPTALPSQLPVTGFPAGAVAVAGVVLVLAGIVLVARARAGAVSG
jgi:hypothetical protein